MNFIENLNSLKKIYLHKSLLSLKGLDKVFLYFKIRSDNDNFCGLNLITEKGYHKKRDNFYFENQPICNVFSLNFELKSFDSMNMN